MSIYETILWLVYKGYVIAFFAGVITCNSVHMILNTNQIRRNSETIRRNSEAIRQNLAEGRHREP